MRALFRGKSDVFSQDPLEWSRTKSPSAYEGQVNFTYLSKHNEII